MNEQSYEYRTGQTTPEKSSRGLIAFLLVCVIFLCGVVSVLGAMNIHLFRQLKLQEASPLAFETGDTTPLTPEGDSVTLGGITFQELPQVYQQLHNLPEGLYVVDAPEGSPVLPGDILTAFGDSDVTSLAAFNALLAGYTEGAQVQLHFFRQNADAFTHTVTFGN